MRPLRRALYFACGWLALMTSSIVACGNANIASCKLVKIGGICSEMNRDEKARQALDEDRIDDAVELLEELIAEDPEGFGRYPLLAAAYAQRGGLSQWDLVRSQLGSGGDLMAALSGFLPSPSVVGEEVYLKQIAEMKKAVALLQSIPSQLIDADSAESYAGGARLQLTLYLTSYSVMYLNRFVGAGGQSQVDLEKLAHMTEDDALMVLNNLAAAGGLSSDPALSAKINEVLAEVNAADGASRKEKLQKYLAENPRSA